MNGCGCEHCEELCQSFKITLPGDLSKAIRIIKDNLADGTIRESGYWPSKHIKVEVAPFAQLDVKGPWKDLLEYYFECSECGQLFRLNAETYHGSGGEWVPVERSGL